MHDPFAWSIPLGRLFGITVRVHWLFPFVALGYVLQAAFYKPPGGTPPLAGAWLDASALMLILFVSVLAHEFGHCLGARAVGGDAQDVLMWPLGGLAQVEVPHRPRAHFLTAAAGPAVNLLVCLGCMALLGFVVADKSFRPPFNPLPSGEHHSFPFRTNAAGDVPLYTWGNEKVDFGAFSGPVWVARVFWVNYFLLLLNVVLVGFPLDGGRMLQAALWPSWGYRQATLTAVFAGFVVVFVVGLYAIVQNSTLALALALFIYLACHRQWVVLETGGDEGLLGYDFSGGYTTLERDDAAPPPRKPGWWQRWRQRRAARRLQREQEERVAEERRLDELLDKVHREGPASLTDEERRFMKRVSDRYKNRR